MRRTETEDHHNRGHQVLITLFAIVFASAFAILWYGLIKHELYFTIAGAVVCGISFISSFLRLIFIKKSFR